MYKIAHDKHCMYVPLRATNILNNVLLEVLKTLRSMPKGINIFAKREAGIHLPYVGVLYAVELND